MHRVSAGGIYSAKLGSLDNRALGYPQVAMKESNCANPAFLGSPRAERGVKAGHPRSDTSNADAEEETNRSVCRQSNLGVCTCMFDISFTPFQLLDSSSLEAVTANVLL